MKRTLITIALTTVVVLTLVGLISSSVGSVFGIASRSSLNYGMGGGGAPESYAEAPAAPSVQSFNGATDLSKAADAASIVNNAPAPQAQQARKVIKNDQLSLLVKDPAQSMKDIVALAEQLGGYVVSSNLYQTTYG